MAVVQSPLLALVFGALLSLLVCHDPVEANIPQPSYEFKTLFSSDADQTYKFIDLAYVRKTHFSDDADQTVIEDGPFQVAMSQACGDCYTPYNDLNCAGLLQKIKDLGGELQPPLLGGSIDLSNYALVLPKGCIYDPEEASGKERFIKNSKPSKLSNPGNSGTDIWKKQYYVCKKDVCACNCDSCSGQGGGKCDTGSCKTGFKSTDTFLCEACDETNVATWTDVCNIDTCDTGYEKTANECTDVKGCAGNPACGADATCVDVVAPGTGYECQCDDGFLGDPVQNGNATCQAKAKCSEWSAKYSEWSANPTSAAPSVCWTQQPTNGCCRLLFEGNELTGTEGTHMSTLANQGTNLADTRVACRAECEARNEAGAECVAIEINSGGNCEIWTTLPTHASDDASCRCEKITRAPCPPPNCTADQPALSDTLFCPGTACMPDDGDTCCVARANCSTITCAAGTEANTSATSQLCAGATCATNDNDLCCQDTDGCLAPPDCGTNGTCADVGAPGTGHKCRCDAGFTVTTTTDGAATCTPVQLGGAALPSTSSAAVWIVSSIFASVFAVSSSGA